MWVVEAAHGNFAQHMRCITHPSLSERGASKQETLPAALTVMVDVMMVSEHTCVRRGAAGVKVNIPQTQRTCQQA